MARRPKDGPHAEQLSEAELQQAYEWWLDLDQHAKTYSSIWTILALYAHERAHERASPHPLRAREVDGLKV